VRAFLRKVFLAFSRLGGLFNFPAQAVVEKAAALRTPSLTEPMQHKEEDVNSPRKQVKYVLVTGGVLSGLGKGIISSSTGMILSAYVQE